MEDTNQNNSTKAVISSFPAYDLGRYSDPWVCPMTATGEHDFDQHVGYYTGHPGKAGDLIVLHPVAGQVYGYGQRDREGPCTQHDYAKWDGTQFTPTDRLGRPIS